MASSPSAPAALSNGNWSYTNAKGITTTGTKDSVQSAYASEQAANPPADSSPGTGATGRYPTGYTPPPAGSSNTNDSAATAETTYMDATKPEDPATIASRVQGEYAAEIAAIEGYYSQLQNQQTTINTNASGRTRATAAASGELGSDMGNASIAAQDKTNQGNTAAISAAEAKDAGAVYGTEASAIEGEITGEKATQQGALAGDVTFKQGQATKAQGQLATIASATDLADLPQNEYDSLYEASGFSTPDQFNQYYEAVRASAKNGGKTIGDATTGVWQQQVDGTWKNIIKGATQGLIGTPDTGVWQKQSDGSYTNVIPAPLKSAAGGSMVFNPTTGQIEAGGSKIITSGGILYSVNTQTNVATPLTANKIGWTATGSGADQEKAAIITYLNNTAGIDVPATLKKIEADPTTYFQALGESSQAGYYTPINLSGTPGASTLGTGSGSSAASSAAAASAADEASQSAQDAADAAANATSDSGSTQ